MEALGELTQGVAHDIYHHVGIIRNYTKFLLQDMSRESAADLRVQENLAIIFDQLDQSEQMTRQLVAFGRNQPVRPAIFCLNTLINALKPVFHAFTFEIDYNLADDLFDVKMDQSGIQQVLTNLLMNAREAGAKHVSISTANSLNGEYLPLLVEMSVSDNGTGMTPEVRDRCLEPYYSTKNAGSGLGLASASRIVTRAGGEIIVHSTPEDGTVMAVVLPAGIRASSN